MTVGRRECGNCDSFDPMDYRDADGDVHGDAVGLCLALDVVADSCGRPCEWWREGDAG